MEAAVGVVGGGPAGAALAIELARLGVPVLVITSPRPRRRFEGLSDRTVALLQRQGFAHACATLGEAGERQAHVLADQLRVALILGVHGDGDVAEQRLRPRRGDDQCPFSIDEGVADLPHRAVLLG